MNILNELQYFEKKFVCDKDFNYIHQVPKNGLMKPLIENGIQKSLNESFGARGRPQIGSIT